MGSHGVEVAACVALGLPWALAASWRACDGTLSRTARAALGGIAAAELAWGAYAVLELTGLGVRFERLQRGDLRALGLAVIVGLVEEAAKLAGALIAQPHGRGEARERARIVLAVAAVFATIEAVLVLPGAAWPLLLGRAAFGPVAHALLAAPVAIAFAEAGGTSGAAPRLAAGLLMSAALHALGDFALTQQAWGRAGFAAALVLPAVWLYARGRRGRTDRARAARVPFRRRAAAALPGAVFSR